MKTMAANSVSQKLVQSLDLSNTVLGGMSQARFNEYETDHLFVVEITTPGLLENNYGLEIKNNILYLYTFFININGNKQPYMMRYFTIPYYVDFTEASAYYNEAGTLQVCMPIIEHLKNYEHSLPIS